MERMTRPIADVVSELRTRALDAERERNEAVGLLTKLASLAEWAGHMDHDDVVSARAFLSRLAQPKKTKP
jgi:hypothetical protein